MFVVIIVSTKQEELWIFPRFFKLLWIVIIVNVSINMMENALILCIIF